MLMAQTWQLVLVGLILSAAVFYLGRQTWRTWSGRKQTGCGGGCSCHSAAAAPDARREKIIPVDQLTVRRTPRGTS
jgi:hypothetical protein